MYFAIDCELYKDVRKLVKQLRNESKGHDTCNEYPSSIFTAILASGHKFTSSQVNTILFIQVNHILLESSMQICNVFESNILFLMQKEMEQKLETKHEFVENVPQQEMPLVPMIPTNSEVISMPNTHIFTSISLC